jgi:hypothetical protein
MTPGEVVAIPTTGDELGIGDQQGVCANPRCDEQFVRTPGPGRRKDFHNEECRRSAERDLRRTFARLEHHERQAEQLRARAAAYLRTSVEPTDTIVTGPTVAEAQAAREAMLEVRGAMPFLKKHEGEFATDLVRLYEAVAPVILPGS